ncbi:MAG: hypothetical protein VB102_10165 [Paludibacter sp.]|nr:hypothetical protein [Paludibacter sp.]
MKKKIIISVIILTLCYVIYFWADFFIHGHSTDWEKRKGFNFLFKESIIECIDTTFTSGYVSRYDTITHFLYVPALSRKHVVWPETLKDTTYRIDIWEFLHMDNISPDSIHIFTNQKLKDIKLKRGEILNSKSNKRTSIRFGYEFKKMTVHIDNYSKVEKVITGHNYKGFFGEITRVSLSNEKGEHQIFVDYVPAQTKALFIFYKLNHRFFIIIIDSDYYFDEKIIEILNLK